MKKIKFYLLISIVLVSASTHAQLIGTRNIPGDYATLAAAITDLNTQGVGAGGVTLNLIAGNNQTAPAGGYSITATGTAGNPITISGNSNTVTASGALTSGSLTDAIFKIIGGDYITLQGFTMQENGSNATTAAGTNNMTEFGVALFYASTVNGAQNNTVQSNTITLNRNYQNTFGIYSNVRHTATDVITAADISSASGSNSNNKFYSNNISNVNIGMEFVGSNTGNFMDNGLEVGGASNGNTISDFGTTGTFSAFVSVATSPISVGGIVANNQLDANLSYNTITSSTGGVLAAATIRGIYCQASGTLPVSGAYTRTINNNNISIKGGIAANILMGIHHDNGNAAFSLNINNNIFDDFDHTSGTGTGAITFINAGTGSAVQNVNINGNAFNNMSVKTAGSITFIEKGATLPANAVVNVNNNAIGTAFAKTTGGGTFRCYSSGTSSPSSVTESNTGNSFTFITISASASTTVTLWQSTDATSKTISNNTFTNLTTGAGSTIVMNVNSGTATLSTVSGNTINTIAGGGNVTGLNFGSGSNNAFNNLINGLSTSGATIVSGIIVNAGTIQNVYKNKVYGLSASNASGTVNGILISGVIPSNALNIHDNLVGDLNCPAGNAADPIRGISISAVTANTSIDVTNNTINLNATAGGTNFGSSGIFLLSSPVSTSGAVRLRNNIIVNTSVFNGTGLAVAIRRSSASLNNFSGLSNNNLLYAGTAGTNRLIFYDVTNSDQTLASYQARVSPRDANSVTESPNFLSTSGASANFLHINTGIATKIESGGIPVPGITDDYDGDSRSSSAPDIGADEFTGIANDVVGPNILFTSLISTFSTSNRTIVATITDATGIASGTGAPLVYYRKGTSGSYFSAVATSISGSDYTFTIDYANVTGGSVAAGDIIQYYIAAQDLSGNVSTVAYGGAGATPPGSTAPANPDKYNIIQSYTWQGTTSDFQTSANWSPVRTIPDASDILIFDGTITATTTISNIPTSTVDKLLFRNNINATLNAATSGNTLTMALLPGQTIELDIQSGSIVNLGTTTGLNLVYDPVPGGQTGTIAGTLSINGTSTFSSANSVTTVSGIVDVKGTATTPIISNETSLLFNSGSTLLWEYLTGGTMPTASYHANSTVNMTGAFTGSIAWPAIPAGNVIFNSTGTAAQSFGSSMTTINGSFTIQNTGTGSFATGTGTGTTISIAGDATINNGTWNVSGNIISIAGNLVQNGGTITKPAANTNAQSWTAASVSQTAGTVLMSNVAGLYTLTASSGNMGFAGSLNGGTTGGMSLGFSGAGNQTLNTTSATLSNRVGITVNKSSGNCTLLSDFTTNSGAAVALTSGKLSIAGSKILTIASGASITGANSSNYIVSEASGANLGKLKYSGLTTAAQSFAIGTATNYMPVTITPTTTNSTFAVGVFEGATVNGAPNGTSLSSPILNNLVKATYQIDNTVTATSASVTFGWAAGQEGTSFSGLSNSAIGVAKYNGASYDPIIGTGDNTANTATASISSFSPFVVGTSVGKASLKLFLQGAYDNTNNRHKDVTSTWAAVLNANALSQPYNVAPFNYTGTESVSNGFFTSTGATTDITDWVLLELRDQTTPATVIARRAAFVREDGVVVDLDGTSNVVFAGVANGNYFMTIRHRNHLSIRTSATIAIDGSISSTGTLYNLTTAQSQAFQDGGIGTNEAMAQDGTTYIMWAGNGNSDIAVRASGPPADNDYLFLVNDVLGGNTATILSNVYHSADFNLDGVVRASGPPAENDYLILVNGILGGNTATIYTAHQ